MAQFTTATSTGATAPAAATAATTTTTNTQEDLTSISRYQLKPPFYNGEYGTFAYMGLMNNAHTRLLQASETATAELTDAQLRAAADTIQDGEKHVQMAADIRHILSSSTSQQTQQQLFADNSNTATASRSIDNSVVDSQFQ